MNTIGTDELTMVETLACHDSRGHERCDWCHKSNPSGRWVRQNVCRPGLHISIAPKCEACGRRDAEKAAGREATT